MWSMIVSLVQGIVTGVVGPLASAYEKKQDVTLEGFKAGTTADQQAYLAWTDYQFKVQQLKLQANNWWAPRALYFAAGAAAVAHFDAVMIDSIPFWGHEAGSWGVPKLPPTYDTYQGWVIASLFVVSLAKGPLSAATAWLQRR